MRIVGIALAIAALAALAGCGSSGQSGPSSESSAPVESASASGAVAGDSRCQPGPPAYWKLRSEPSNADTDDGVVGAVYNDTSKPIGVKTESADGHPCRLDPGSRAAFMGRESFVVQIYAYDDLGAPRSELRLTDPYWWGGPSAEFEGPRWRETCPQRGRWGVDDMREGTGATLGDTAGAGVVEVKRLNDDKNTAIEWSGTTSAGDWARIDIRVKSAPVCS